MNILVYVVAAVLWKFVADKTFEAVPWYGVWTIHIIGCAVLYYCIVWQHQKSKGGVPMR